MQNRFRLIGERLVGSARARPTRREQLERLERYGAHLAAQNDRLAERLDRLERAIVQLSGEQERTSTLVTATNVELRSRIGGSRLIGVLPAQLVRDLSGALGIRRAVETGTYLGSSTRKLASIFPEVATIEISRELHEAARERLADLPGVTCRHGDSSAELPLLASLNEPTLYWLDGHWSAADTGGRERQCPLLDELGALAGGHPDDCMLIDDARFFLAAPPPPWSPELWPSVAEVIDALRTVRPSHHITVLHDLIIAVPARAASVVDAFAWAPVVPDEA
jgi:hypothetical protein